MPQDPKPHSRKIELQPAPGTLHRLQRFLNTVDLRAGTDTLASPAALEQWAIRERLAPPRSKFSQADHQQVIAFRTGVRDALVGGSGNPEVIEDLQRITAGAVLQGSFAPGGGFALVPAHEGVDGVLGQLLVIAVEAQVQGWWPRLRVCACSTCRTAFYDFSPNLSAIWCRPKCGNRLSARITRRRQRRESGGLY